MGAGWWDGGTGFLVGAMDFLKGVWMTYGYYMNLGVTMDYIGLL